MTSFNDDDIRKGWQNSKTARTYDNARFSSWSGKLSDWLDKRALRKSLDFSQCNKNSIILDMPVGTGRMSLYMVSLGYENIKCADISKDMLTVAGNLLNPIENIEYYHTDASDTAFPDKFCDVIISVRFMGHLPKKNRCTILKEMSRICNGKIIVEYPITNPFAHMIKKVFRFLTVKNVLPAQWKWHYLRINDAKREIEEAELVIEKIIRKFFIFSESAYLTIGKPM